MLGQSVLAFLCDLQLNYLNELFLAVGAQFAERDLPRCLQLVKARVRLLRSERRAYGVKYACVRFAVAQTFKDLQRCCWNGSHHDLQRTTDPMFADAVPARTRVIATGPPVDPGIRWVQPRRAGCWRVSRAAVCSVRDQQNVWRYDRHRRAVVEHREPRAFQLPRWHGPALPAGPCPIGRRGVVDLRARGLRLRSGERDRRRRKRRDRDEQRRGFHWHASLFARRYRRTNRSRRSETTWSTSLLRGHPSVPADTRTLSSHL